MALVNLADPEAVVLNSWYAAKFQISGPIFIGPEWNLTIPMCNKSPGGADIADPATTL